MGLRTFKNSNIETCETANECLPSQKSYTLGKNNLNYIRPKLQSFSGVSDSKCNYQLPRIIPNYSFPTVGMLCKHVSLH